MPQTGEFSAHVATAADVSAACAICQTGFAEGELIGPCPACGATFHEECWKDNGGCAVYGCAKMPQTVKDPEAAARPMTYWGQDTKKCPQCAEMIKVAAIRCRFCGATFASAAPISRGQHLAALQRKPAVESMKRTSLTLFVCGLIPCLAPIALIAGGIWFLTKREEIRKLPSTNQMFCIVGLIAAAVCTLLMSTVLVLI